MAYQGRGSKTGAKIVAKSVKAQGGKAGAAKTAAKTAAKAAVFVYNPNKVGKVFGAAKKATKAAREATKNEARKIAAKRAAETPAAKRTEAQKLAMKRVVTNQRTGATKVRPESKTDVKRLVKESKKSKSKTPSREEREYEKIRTTQYNPKTRKREELVAGSSKVSQARMAEFKRQGFGQSGNVVRKFKTK